MLSLGQMLATLVLLCGCRGVTTSYAYPEDLEHPNYVKRSKAVLEFARLRDADRLPGAFGLLLDDEAHIRALAYVTIKGLMPDGDDFGYRPYLDAEVRESIVARWEAWWRAGRTAEAGRG